MLLYPEDVNKLFNCWSNTFETLFQSIVHIKIAHMHIQTKNVINQLTHFTFIFSPWYITVTSSIISNILNIIIYWGHIYFCYIKTYNIKIHGINSPNFTYYHIILQNTLFIIIILKYTDYSIAINKTKSTSCQRKVV